MNMDLWHKVKNICNFTVNNTRISQSIFQSIMIKGILTSRQAKDHWKVGCISKDCLPFVCICIYLCIYSIFNQPSDVILLLVCSVCVPYVHGPEHINK